VSNETSRPSLVGRLVVLNTEPTWVLLFVVNRSTPPLLTSVVGEQSGMEVAPAAGPSVRQAPLLGVDVGNIHRPVGVAAEVNDVTLSVVSVAASAVAGVRTNPALITTVATRANADALREKRLRTFPIPTPGEPPPNRVPPPFAGRDVTSAGPE
jgi:hypothetical protein